MAKINIAAEAGNVTDDDAQVHELLSMGLANDVFAGAKPVLLPNVKEKKANGFHERRFVRGQSGARASLTRAFACAARCAWASWATRDFFERIQQNSFDL